ncbi:nucleoside triphosphate pyrophosphohydrolase [Senegalia sp. (in: firmicutes)]|uniref:nucleoside triphosphate pyrophosphohydrolase n=1 Tax=Senegalia sp. (in: firmicutes) TaxID=1924098 RepID=UPI003F952EED
MAKINIIGLGFGDIDDLTLKSINLIKNHKNFFRTDKSPAIEYLKENKIDFLSYDKIYESEEDFDNVYNIISEDLIQKAKNYSVINYCVPKTPALFDKVTEMLLEKKFKNEIEIKIFNNGGFLEKIYDILEKPITNNVKIIDALELKPTQLDINSDLIIFGIYDNIIASEVKIHLEEVYKEDYRIKVINDFSDKDKCFSIPIYKLDRLDEYNHNTLIYISKTKDDKRNYDMNNLIDIMERLRSKDGCAFDNEQTHESLRAYLVEEAYEVIDAIDNNDVDSLEEELGDLLLQIVFHSQIAKEEGYFNIWNVINGISDKMIYRHPHVFSGESTKDIDEINYKWDKLKNKSKGIESISESMMSIPKDFPMLLKAYKIQKKAAKVGFDWDYKEEAYEKIKEEIEELKLAIDSNTFDDIEDEFGDLLFAIVNFSRFLEVNPHIALNRTINKFIFRFKYIEDTLVKEGKQLEKTSLEDMDILWNQAKKLK